MIIDNMMNLELLFAATKLTGDSTFYRIAVSHADNTIRNHYRPDYSTWHVIDYSKADGSVRHRNTHQGYSDESSWSRGQSWGVYGYVLCYRETGDQKYLDQAEKALEFIAGHPNYPEDGVTYWDFDSPDIPDTYRDASRARSWPRPFMNCRPTRTGRTTRMGRPHHDHAVGSDIPGPVGRKRRLPADALGG